VTLLAVFIGCLVSASKEHSKWGVATLRLSIPPGGSQTVNAYMEAGDRLDLSWTANGVHLGYEYQLIEGHNDAVLGAGLSDKGGKRFNADHGSLYGVAFQNHSTNNARVVVRATGSFEFFKEMSYPPDAQKIASLATHRH
jgi:hypothetical protein